MRFLFILFLFILFLSFSLNAQVPNTSGGWSLNDVRVVLGLSSTASLQDCFSASEDALFDPNYVEAKNRLLNFRNYGGGTIKTISVSTTTYGSFPEICGASPSFVTKYFYDYDGLAYPSDAGNTIFNEIGMTTIFNGGNLYYKLQWTGGSGANQIGTDGKTFSTTALCP